MNEFDQFVKRTLKIKFYVRYADDFLFINCDKEYLIKLLPELEKFLEEKLKLAMHPKKVFLKTLNSGVDFLGWVQFHHYRVLRTTTKNRMLKKIKINQSQPTLVAYLALLKHGNSYKIKNKINSINKPL